MISYFTSSIHKGFLERKDKVGAYRFLSNERITEQDLIERLTEPIISKVEDQRLLVLCDTTEFNINNHKGRITDFTGLGSTTNSDILGFFSHNQLVLERESKQTIGWSNISLFNRPINKKPYVRANYTEPITNKESNKWYEPSLYSRDKKLDRASHSLFVMDREADIFEVLSSLPSEKCDFLIRAKHNRIVYTKAQERINLKAAIAERSVKAKVKVKVNGESRKRKKRIAMCELRYGVFKIPRPVKIYGKENYPALIELSFLQIKEVGKIPNGELPIVWTLWTSEKIKNISKAKELLSCYSARWAIEEAHRLLKKKGFDIESSELESGKSIRKLLILGMEASLKVMKLKSARSGETEIKTVELFDENEIEFLELLNEKLKGSTELLSNPYNKNKLSWASWIIARLGGWQGYNSQRKPGTIIFKRGLDIFYQQYNGFLIAKRI